MSWLLSSVSDSLVALRKESVDRNLNMWSRIRIFQGRSPQGERG